MRHDDDRPDLEPTGTSRSDPPDGSGPPTGVGVPDGAGVTAGAGDSRGADVPAGADVVVPLPADPHAADLLRHGIGRLAAVDHPHLAVLRRVRNNGDRLILQYDVAADARPLPELLANRPAPLAGQLVTLGVPWAQALAALHEAGLTVGSADVADLWIAPDGRPVLLPRGVRPGDADARAADVAAVARCLRGVAPGSMPGALALVLLRAADDDPAVRPAAAAFASSLLAAAVPVPLGPLPRLPSDVAEPAPADDAPPSDETAAERAGVVPTHGAAGVSAAGGDLLAGLRHRTGPPERRSAGSAGSRWRAVRRLILVGGVVAAGLAGLSVAVSGDPAATPSRSAAGVTTAPSSAATQTPAAGGLTTSATPATGATDATAPTSERSPAPDGPTGTGSAVPPAPTSNGGAMPGSGAPAARPVPDPAAVTVPDPATAGWAGVLEALDLARSRAFATVDEEALSAAALVGSPAYAADRSLLRRFASAGVRPDGFALEVISVREVSRAGGVVRLDVVDRRPGYRLRDETGAVVATRPARGPARWEVVVAPDAAGVWRVRAVAARPS